MLLASGGEVRTTSCGRSSRPVARPVRPQPRRPRPPAATEAFEHYLGSTSFTVEQVRFVGHIVDELTRNGVMEPGRLFESPLHRPRHPVRGRRPVRDRRHPAADHPDCDARSGRIERQ